MSDPGFSKCPCAHCGVHLEFPVDAVGTEVDCPECGRTTRLALAEAEPEPEPAVTASGFTATELLAAFSGPVRWRSGSPLYTVGLGIVAATMLVLPMLYLAMVVAALWGVYYWATHFAFLLASTGGGVRFYLLKAVCYVGPLFAGAVLVFFMIKPLFARRAPRAQPLALNPEAEPLVYAFVEELCRMVGAPRPTRIDLDCQFNASASLRRGFWSLFRQDLVLTVGLPLAAGLSLRQFTGVLAHEFGHFTQGLGMRLAYLIRSVNAWFARVVFERDAWDIALTRWAEIEEWYVAIVVALARLGVWFSRAILHLLMLVGHGIGCFLLRQMEYDADSYQIRVVGSETFESTVRRIHVLGALLGHVYQEMRGSWNLNRHLPVNFPAYLLWHDANLPAGQRTQLEDTMGLEPTRLLHTHPSNGDRIRRARQANEPGIFRLDGPATALFGDFEVVAHQVTLLHYTDDLGLPRPLLRLVSVPPERRPAGASASE